MKLILLVSISVQLWQAQVDSKAASKPCGLGAQPPKTPENNTQSNNNGTRISNRRAGGEDVFEYMYMKFTQKGAMKYGLYTRMEKEKATTTTKIYLDNDCDYVNYYCMRGFYTGQICARTIYNTYETFKDYCELEYVNCMENYELWVIAHMGECYNVSSYNFFAYYAYAVWDDQQLEDLYVLPSK